MWFFPGRVVDELYFLLYFLLNATTAPRNLHVLEKKKYELFIPDLLRDVFLLDCGIIFLNPNIFNVQGPPPKCRLLNFHFIPKQK